MALTVGIAPEPTPEVFSLNKEKYYFSFFIFLKKNTILKAKIEGLRFNNALSR